MACHRGATTAGMFFLHEESASKQKEMTIASLFI
jgi:hypothetical protein